MPKIGLRRAGSDVGEAPPTCAPPPPGAPSLATTALPMQMCHEQPGTAPPQHTEPSSHPIKECCMLRQETARCRWRRQGCAGCGRGVPQCRFRDCTLASWRGIAVVNCSHCLHCQHACNAMHLQESSGMCSAAGAARLAFRTGAPQRRRRGLRGGKVWRGRIVAQQDSNATSQSSLAPGASWRHAEIKLCPCWPFCP